MTGQSNGVREIRAQYYGQSFSQPRVRPVANTYKAKVIDYSNGIIERPRVIDYTHRSPAPAMQSVLTERNIGPMQTHSRTNQSVNALHSAISSAAQKPMVPKPILKNPIRKTSQMSNTLKPSFTSSTLNTSTPLSQRSIPPKSAIPELRSRKEVTDNSCASIAGHEYENNGIILFKDEENNTCFYCHHCNVYIKKSPKVEKHLDLDFHKKVSFTIIF